MNCNCGSILNSLPCCCPSETTTTTTFTPCVGGEICEEEYTTDCIIYTPAENTVCPFSARTSYTEIIETILTGFFPVCNNTTTTTTTIPITTTSTTTTIPITTSTTTLITTTTSSTTTIPATTSTTTLPEGCPVITVVKNNGFSPSICSTVSWSSVVGAVNYFLRVYRAIDNFIMYASYVSNGTGTTVCGLTVGVEYYTTVYPCSNSGCTSYTVCPPVYFTQE